MGKLEAKLVTRVGATSVGPSTGLRLPGRLPTLRAMAELEARSRGRPRSPAGAGHQLMRPCYDAWLLASGLRG